jgi:hypothetical protein
VKQELATGLCERLLLADLGGEQIAAGAELG